MEMVEQQHMAGPRAGKQLVGTIVRPNKLVRDIVNINKGLAFDSNKMEGAAAASDPFQ